ncbi:MAG: phosphogluconate dehydratase [Porticoccaceae bacterium]
MREVISEVRRVTDDIEHRSKPLRDDYLRLVEESRHNQPERAQLSCGNLAHGFAACEAQDKSRIRLLEAANIGIVTAYNDMLSAHNPYGDYPQHIKEYAREMACTAQVAGGVPAMCDGVIQGRPGGELGLFSRDVIAQATAVALSHQMFDGVLCLGICDKIVPGLLIGSLSFGHLPMLFVPGGPMRSGLPNKEKQRIRELYAEGKVGREELLDAEAASYHSPGTCTFYGTANSNQILMEAMGLQLPGSSFVNPDTALRAALTREATHQLLRITAQSSDYRPLGKIVDARALVNAMVALLASGGSTNHSIHLVAVARAAGLIINWDDFSRLSHVTPLLARIYPNGHADVNHFHAAGGTTYLFSQLLDAGLMHGDAQSVWGGSLADFVQEPYLRDGALAWRPTAAESRDHNILRAVSNPFDSEGGLRLLTGNLGRAVIKISAVAPAYRRVEGPAVVVPSPEALQERFERGELDRDCVVVVRFQGPQANGMPELHKLTPMLGVLLERGHKVALVTDGRMSGASGKIPAAIHLSPEAFAGGPIARIEDGDWIVLDAENGVLECTVPAQTLAQRKVAQPEGGHIRGAGRELFANFRRTVSRAEQGATVLFEEYDV